MNIKITHRIDLLIIPISLILILIGPSMLTAQHSISGTVTNTENGKTLPGVNVLVKGTNIGTATNSDGNFSLQAPGAQDTLVFSFIGFQPREIPIKNRTKINVVLTPDVQALSEVVVVGYGTKQKRDLTGAISQVSGEDLETQSVATVQEALAGKLTGVQVQQTSGQPGASPTLRVRGLSSLSAGNNPLIVIDGFVGADFSQLNPADIASIEVLKDASSAAIYGSRGANGVVIITTKEGTSGKPRFNLNLSSGIQTIGKKIDMLGRDEWLQAYREALDNAYRLKNDLPLDGSAQAPKGNKDYVRPRFRNEVDKNGNPFPNTDWQDVVYDPAPITNAQLSVRGGTDDVNYYVSGGVLDQQGTMIETDFKRFNLRANIQAKLSDKVEVGVNLAPSYEMNQQSANDNFRNGPAFNAITTPPIYSPYKEDGSFSPGPNTPEADEARIWQTINPVLNQMGTDNKTVTTRIISNGYINYEVIDGLTMRGNFGATLSGGNQDFYKAGFVGRANVFQDLPGFGYAVSNSSRNLLAEYTANYRKKFDSGHNLDFLAGYSAQVSHTEFERVDAGQYVSDAVPTINNGVVTSGDASIGEWSLLSFISRLSYDYKSKYLVTATFRRDGSSRFSSNERFGNFPSASVGWLFTKEDFLKNSFLSYGKIRASYGIVGNFNIGNYSSRSRIGTGASYFFNNSLSTGYDYLNVPDPNLGWEQISQLDLGLELGFVEDRFRFEFDYYQGKSKELLLNIPLPTSIPFGSYLTNLGKVQNKGFEININTRNTSGAFLWKTNVNFSLNRNKVLELRGDGVPLKAGISTYSTSHITQVGKPIGSFYGYKLDGVYRNQEEIDAALPGSHVVELGYARIVDSNKDGMINSDDRTSLGSPEPDFIYGITNRFAYKGFDLTVVANGQVGGEIYNALATETNTLSASRNMTALVRGRYRSPSNPGNGYPILQRYKNGAQPVGRNDITTIYLEDASFFRIRDLTLGYDLSNLVESGLYRSARIYLNAHNLLTLTSYRGYDPELNSSNNILTPGIDLGSYPTSRIFTIGINIGF